jgi:hypothetical protein
MKVLAGLLMSAALLVSSASASIITQTVSIGTQPTDVSGSTALFNFFASAGAPGGSVLNSVTLEIVINETLTALTLHNTSNATATFNYADQANFDAGDSANATDGNNLDIALGNSFNQGDPAANIYATHASLAGGASCSPPCGSNLNGLPQTLTEDTGIIAGNTGSYTGSGTFNLNYSTISGFSVTGSNNVQVAQTNVTNAVATVIYNYSTPSGVPEPATLAIFGSGLLGLSLIGRKKLLGKK